MFIVKRLNQTLHLTLHALKDELAGARVKCLHNAVWLFLRRGGLRFKKRCSALEQGRSDAVARRSRRWRHRGRPASIRDAWSLSTRHGIKTNMVPLRDGRLGRVLACEASRRMATRRTMTFLGALRCDRLTAPCVFDGPINGECFRAYVEQLLVPCLGPGDVVIMDNLGSHKSSRAASHQQGRRCKAVGYLPPYSPDLNPIEQAFAKIKHWMRAAQKRTVDELWRHIGGLVSTIQHHECSNYFANAGYASIKP